MTALPESESASPARLGVNGVHGSWSPGSLDLAVELPALLDTVAAAGHDVHRVDYNLDAWDRAPRKMVVGGRLVKLTGFRTQDPTTITLVDTSNFDSTHNERITFDVTPPVLVTTSRAA